MRKKIMRIFSFAQKSKIKEKNMEIQDKTIRIDINIDDGDIRNLNHTMGDLNGILSDLEVTLNNYVGSMGDMLRVIRETESSTGILSSTMSDAATSASMMTFASGTLFKSFEVGKGKISASSVALGAFKTALGGIGFGVAIWGVGQLIGWLGSLIFETNETSEEVKTLEERISSLREEIEDNRQEHEDNIRSIRAHRQSMNSLIDRVIVLSNATDLSTDEQNELRTAIELLNRETSDYTLTLGGVTDGLCANSEEILENMRNYHNLNGAMAESDEILGELISLHYDLNDAAIRVEELAEANGGLEVSAIELRAAQEELFEKIEANNEVTLTSREHHEELTEANRLLALSIDEIQEEIDGMCEHLVTAQVEMYDIQNRINELEAEGVIAFENMEKAVAESTQGQILSLDDLSEAQRDVVDELSRTFNSYVDQLRGANGKIRENNEFTAEHWQDVMEHNQTVMGYWANNVDALAGRVSDEMLDYIRNLGPEHAQLVEDMVEMSGGELAELEAVFRNNCQVAGQAALAGIDDANIPQEVANLIFESEQTVNAAIRGANFQGLGLNMAEGLRDGIKDGEILVGTGAAALAREAEEAVRAESETNSPSRVFYRIGCDLVAGLVEGLEALKSRPIRNLEQLARHMQRVYNNSQREYREIGRNVMEGLRDGLLSREDHLMSAARRIAENMQTTMKHALDINSPSRVMREQVGRFIPEGVAAGINKYANVAIDSVDKLANDMIKLNIPSIESIIGMGPSLNMAGLTSGSSSTDNRVINNNQGIYAGLFEGAHIHWHNKEDIRRTMEKMARVAEDDGARMW